MPVQTPAPPIRRPLARLSACVLAAAALGACQMRGDFRPLSSELPPPPAIAQVSGECQASGARFALGRHITAPLMEEIRMRAGARVARTALPNEAAPPAEPQRLSIDIEPDGRILGLRCE